MWMRWFLVGQSLVSQFMLESILVKRNSIEKQVAKPSENDGFVTPQKHTESRRKIVWPNEFRGKNNGWEQIKNVPIILEATLRLMSQFTFKVYVGNAPPNHRLMMMGHARTHFFGCAQTIPKFWGQKMNPSHCRNWHCVPKTPIRNYRWVMYVILPK
jgi:hypothetical protein